MLDFRLTIFDCGKRLHKRFLNLFLNFASENWKFKICPELGRRIQNQKWGGTVALIVAFALFGAVAQAQQPAKIPRIGFLIARSPSANAPRVEAFRQGLRELGYVEEKDILIEWRFWEGKADRLPALAAELVRLKVNIIVTGGATNTRAAKEATSTIPIVMTQAGDPVASGFVASLARPGGNITGLSTLSPDISGKQLELLKEIIPRLSRVAVLGNSAIPIVKRDGTRRRGVGDGASIPRCTRSERYRNCLSGRKERPC
jgi:hypothetical protein